MMLGGRISDCFLSLKPDRLLHLVPVVECIDVKLLLLISSFLLMATELELSLDLDLLYLPISVPNFNQLAEKKNLSLLRYSVN